MPAEKRPSKALRAPSKKAILEARRQELGRCSELTGETKECRNWGIDRVNGRAYCGTHLTMVALREDRERRAAKQKAALDASIAAYIAWTAAHPSVHDRMPTTSG